MVRLTQNVEAAFEVETNYSDPADSSLTHLGLLDTFDPRQVEMNVTPVPSLGQSTDAHHAAGPIDVTIPIKVACQGTGWKQLLGRAIGAIDIDDSGGGTTLVPHKLSIGTPASLAILVKETGVGFTLATGVVPNEVTLEADYTTGGYITVDAQCTAFFTQDSDDMNLSDNSGFLIDNYADGGVSFPAAPTDDPLLPSDLVVSFAKTSNLETELTIDGPAGSYIEIGEKYLRTFDLNNVLDSNVDAGGAVTAAGVVNLTNAAADTLGDLDTLFGTSSGAGKSGWTVPTNTNTSLTTNLLKGIYSTDTSRTIQGVDSTSTTLPNVFSNLKTVSLKIANNNTPIPARVTRGASSNITKWLQNASIAQGKADVTLDLTMTAENEDLYDIYVSGGVIPLVRLDFGDSVGSIALTNGTITSFTRPLTGGTEIVDTVSIKFRGAGDARDFSSLAISADWTV
ncbi:MAG TPA: hypothetical protein DCM40_30835 [Maribacter sp.]|nr:hypothetical protein [Maribacter sp.]